MPSQVFYLHKGRRQFTSGARTMSTIRTFATVAIAGFIAAPLSAQTVQDRVEQARRRAESNQQTTVRDRIEQARRRAEGGVLSRTGSGGVLSRTDSRRGGSKVPP